MGEENPSSKKLTDAELKIIKKNMKEGRRAIGQYIYDLNEKPHPIAPEKKK